MTLPIMPISAPAVPKIKAILLEVAPIERRMPISVFLIVDEDNQHRDDIGTGNQNDHDGNQHEEILLALQFADNFFGEFVFFISFNIPVRQDARLFECGD